MAGKHGWESDCIGVCIFGWHHHCPTPGPDPAVPRPPQRNWTDHPVHYWNVGGWDTPISGHQDFTATVSSLPTTVFWKESHTDRYLDYGCHHPLGHKIVTSKTLLIMADRICTSITDKDAEKRHISGALNKNGYPMELARKIWQVSSRPDHVSDLPSARKGTVVIPYVWHASECIPRILSHWRSAFPSGHITPWGRHWSTRKTASHCNNGEEWFTTSHVAAAPRHI